MNELFCAVIKAPRENDRYFVVSAIDKTAAHHLAVDYCDELCSINIYPINDIFAICEDAILEIVR